MIQAAQRNEPDLRSRAVVRLAGAMRATGGQWAFRWSTAGVAPSPRVVRKAENVNASRREHR